LIRTNFRERNGFGIAAPRFYSKTCYFYSATRSFLFVFSILFRKVARHSLSGRLRERVVLCQNGFVSTAGEMNTSHVLNAYCSGVDMQIDTVPLPIDRLPQDAPNAGYDSGLGRVSAPARLNAEAIPEARGVIKPLRRMKSDSTTQALPGVSWSSRIIRGRLGSGGIPARASGRRITFSRSTWTVTGSVTAGKSKPSWRRGGRRAAPGQCHRWPTDGLSGGGSRCVASTRTGR
jgi:hypothetical protein